MLLNRYYKYVCLKPLVSKQMMKKEYRMSDLYRIFSLWNYTFLFLTLSTLCVFTVDMIGHKTRTISALIFSISVLISVIIGELCVTLGLNTNHEFWLIVSILLTLLFSILIPIKFRTIDITVSKRGRKVSNSFS
jgi:hypothetical protein